MTDITEVYAVRTGCGALIAVGVDMETVWATATRTVSFDPDEVKRRYRVTREYLCSRPPQPRVTLRTLQGEVNELKGHMEALEDTVGRIRTTIEGDHR